MKNKIAAAALSIFLATLMVAATLICDLLYKLVDPRINYD